MFCSEARFISIVRSYEDEFRRAINESLVSFALFASFVGLRLDADILGTAGAEVEIGSVVNGMVVQFQMRRCFALG